jgi:ubiquinone/menaquinone biosynthesis C-methylase UbiE
MFQEHLRSVVSKGNKVLEVGCLTGYRLNDIAKSGAECFGIDPSHLAIQQGRARYPDIHLTEGVGQALPYADNEFDVVYMNFVLYCVPRQFLLRTMSEVDRVLKDGGRIIIADFYPDAPHKRPDQHAPGEFSYKQNFWEVYTSSNLYRVVKMFKYAFKSNVTDDSLTGGDDDCITVDMQKNLEDYYPTKDL